MLVVFSTIDRAATTAVQKAAPVPEIMDFYIVFYVMFFDWFSHILSS
jgi:hypothetical protein